MVAEFQAERFFDDLKLIAARTTASGIDIRSRHRPVPLARVEMQARLRPAILAVTLRTVGRVLLVSIGRSRLRQHGAALLTVDHLACHDGLSSLVYE